MSCLTFTITAKWIIYNILHMPGSHCIMTQSAKMRGEVIILYFVGFLIKTSCANAAPRIFGGQPVDIKHRPFMLSLHSTYGSETVTWRNYCGASIISSIWALTAYHCVDEESSSQYYVRAGSNRLDKDGSMHKVINIHIYNKTYDNSSETYPYDIALLEVKPPFHFSETVQPIDLPKSTHEIQRQLFVCGWGLIEKDTKAKTLMGAYVDYVPYDTCSLIYKSGINNDYHLCYGSSEKDTCEGDSGGPLADKTTIYGITSFGMGYCGYPGAGVYVKVSYYRKWIKNITNL